jgi:hypothetical protein
MPVLTRRRALRRVYGVGCDEPRWGEKREEFLEPAVRGKTGVKRDQPRRRSPSENIVFIGILVNRAGLEPATRCCIQKCYVVGSSSISLRHTSRFCTVFGTVLFPNLFPDSQKCNEPMLLAGVVTVVELSRVEFKAQLE